MPAWACNAIENSKGDGGMRLAQMHAAAVFADQRVAQSMLNGVTRAW